jgi:hypothetical protein
MIGWLRTLTMKGFRGKYSYCLISVIGGKRLFSTQCGALIKQSKTKKQKKNQTPWL